MEFTAFQLAGLTLSVAGLTETPDDAARHSGESRSKKGEDEGGSSVLC